MGQYFVYVNPARREYVDPGGVGFNNKEYRLLQDLPGRVVALLVCDAVDDPGPLGLEGSWLGDPLVVAGDDYGKPNILGLKTSTATFPERNLYHLACEEFTDLTLPGMAMLAYRSIGDATDVAEAALKIGDVLTACDEILRCDGCKPLELALHRVCPTWRQKRRTSTGISKWPTKRFPIREH